MVYIKRLTIEGFRSYRDRCTVTFDESYNVIVGLNGNGKSNLLAAIKFVCASQNLKPSDASKLLHHSGSNPVTMCRVDMMFAMRSNENRFPDGIWSLDATEVTFTRRLTSKKDEYMIDNKMISTEMFRTQLECLQFTNFNNPYYIVQQGRVAEIAGQTDQQRYRLLAEAAGVTFYENRRKESEKELALTITRIAQVRSTMAGVIRSLERLEEESAETAKYIQIQSELDYCMERNLILRYQQNKKDKTNKEGKLARYREQTADLLTDIESLKRTIYESIETKDILNAKIDVFEDQKKSLTKDIQDLEVQCSNLSSVIAAAKSEADKAMSARQRLEDEMKEIEQKKAACETMNKDAGTKLASLEDQLREALNEIDLKSIERTALADRCNPDEKKYETIEERNEDLSKQLKVLEEEIAHDRSRVKLQKQRISALESDKTRIVAELDSLRASTIDTTELRQELIRLQDLLNNKQSEKNRIQSELKAIDRARNDYSTTGLNARTTSPFGRTGIWKNGYNALEWILEQHPEIRPNVYGSLIENFTLKPVPGTDNKPYTAIDAIGNNLDNLLVKDQETLEIIRQGCRQYDEARHTLVKLVIVPLNEIRARRARQNDRPKRLPPNTYRLTDLLEYDEMFEPAIEQSFGRFLLTSDNDEQTEKAALRDKWTCVRLDGTITDSRGISEGGKIKPRMKDVELNLMKRKESELHMKQKEALKSQLQKIEQDRSEISKQINEVKNEQAQRHANNSHIARKTEDYDQRSNELEIEMEQATGLLRTSEKNVELLDRRIVILRCEITLPDLGFTKSDEKKLKQLQMDITSLEKTTDRLKTQISDLTDERDDLSSNLQHLKEEILRLTHELSELDDDVEGDGLDNGLAFQITNDTAKLNNATIEKETKINDLKELNTEYSAMKAGIASCEQRIDKNRSMMIQLEEKHAGVRDKQVILQKEYNDLCSLIEKDENLAQAALRREKRSRGQLDEKYGSLTSLALKREIDRLKEERQAMGNINHSAYAELTKHQEDIRGYQEEQLNSEQRLPSIREMIEHCDQKAEVTFSTAYNNINHHFGHIFSRIVPGGRAVLSRSKDRARALTNGGADDENAHPLDDEGISIKVSFSGNSNSYYRMQQLSGGQRTVVAVALIFALQAGQPVPIYVLDEIDQALDDQYRHAVATIMDDASSRSQFIMTTFRKQLASFGKHFVKVSLVEKNSAHSVVSKEQALETISEAQAQEQ